MIFVYLALLIGSLYLLAVVTEDFFIESLDRISKRIGLSHEAAGATLMAVGSSAPEFFTALFAVFRAGGGHANVGAGTIVGSAIFNILVIIGVSAMFKRAMLTWQVALRDLLFYVVSILMLLYVFWDGRITLPEALIFLLMYVFYVVAVVNWRRLFRYEEEIIEMIEVEVSHGSVRVWATRIMRYMIPDPKKWRRAYPFTFVMSILAISALSFVLVEAAIGLSTLLSISPTIVALTVLAAGTSIPDLLSSVHVAKQGRGDMAVANAVGSNIFDILFVLGFVWALSILINGQDVIVGTENLLSSVILLFATVIAILFILIVKRWSIGRYAGALLVLLYVAYLGFNIYQVLGGA